VNKRRFDRTRFVEEAIAQAGQDDLGDPSWEEGLDILLDSMKEEARLSDLGVEIASADISGYLANRLDQCLAASSPRGRPRQDRAADRHRRTTPDRHHHPL